MWYNQSGQRGGTGWCGVVGVLKKSMLVIFVGLIILYPFFVKVEYMGQARRYFLRFRCKKAIGMVAGW